jgi:hypothetical protein
MNFVVTSYKLKCDPSASCLLQTIAEGGAATYGDMSGLENVHRLLFAAFDADPTQYATAASGLEHAVNRRRN